MSRIAFMGQCRKKGQIVSNLAVIQVNHIAVSDIHRRNHIKGGIHAVFQWFGNIFQCILAGNCIRKIFFQRGLKGLKNNLRVVLWNINGLIQFVGKAVIGWQKQCHLNYCILQGIIQPFNQFFGGFVGACLAFDKIFIVFFAMVKITEAILIGTAAF